MSGQQSQFGCRLLSIPPYENDPSCTEWGSGVVESSHPGGEAPQHSWNSGLATSGGGFHNHFTNPGSPSHQHVQAVDRMGRAQAGENVRYTSPGYHSTLYRSHPASAVWTPSNSSQPIEIRGAESSCRATGTSAPNRNYGSNNNYGGNAGNQVQMNSGSLGSVLPSQTFWASHFPFHFPHQHPPQPATAIVAPIPGNPTLVSYSTHPLGQSGEWNPWNGLRATAPQGHPSNKNSLVNGGVGDPNDGRGKKPRSPLDGSFPPITGYLNEEYGGPIIVTPRNAFTPRYHVLRACGQIAPIPIELIFKSLDKVYKVNEGVFGEVYTGLFNGAKDESVYKLVPIEGAEAVNGEPQKRFDQIETEIRVSQRLNTLRDKGGRNFTQGFSNLYRARVLMGSYPRVLVQAWNSWHEAHKSDNDVPHFVENQLYVVFEYEHCGSDVESFTFRDAEQSYAVLLQVAFALAVAESALDFEHRDLHWGNILVAPTSEASIHYRLNGIGYHIPSGGLKTSIIDFTMARCNDEMGNPVFDDLHDDEVQFMGTTDYQFEIYRKMRQINGNDWSTFHPRTNVLWLHYLADKFLQNAPYNERSTKAHKTYRNLLKVFYDQILQNDSCVDYVKRRKECVKPIGPPGSVRRA